MAALAGLGSGRARQRPLEAITYVPSQPLPFCHLCCLQGVYTRCVVHLDKRGLDCAYVTVSRTACNAQGLIARTMPSESVPLHSRLPAHYQTCYLALCAYCPHAATSLWTTLQHTSTSLHPKPARSWAWG